ncbi:MAG: BREX protein BrxB domain-containing protein [Anaerolineae bacterium]
MSEIELLLQQYDHLVGMPWAERLSGAEKVWFVVYEPAQERRLRLRVQEFQIVTERAGHGWRHVDLTDAFARWMTAHRYRESYFQRPHLLNEAALSGFATAAAEQIKAALAASDVDNRTVVAVSGLGSLFGVVRASDVLGQVTGTVIGRLLIFFPGRYENKVYRLLDARDGQDYLAVPITAETQG